MLDILDKLLILEADATNNLKVQTKRLSACLGDLYKIRMEKCYKADVDGSLAYCYRMVMSLEKEM
jgi:hypothetical protein